MTSLLQTKVRFTFDRFPGNDKLSVHPGKEFPLAQRNTSAEPESLHQSLFVKLRVRVCRTSAFCFVVLIPLFVPQRRQGLREFFKNEQHGKF